MYCSLISISFLTIGHVSGRTPHQSLSLIFSSGCDSEQVTAGILGYTQVSWDDVSGKTKQPRVEDKTFAELTHEERVAAVALGYTAKTWDNESGKEKEPASEDKLWAELTACGE